MMSNSFGSVMLRLKKVNDFHVESSDWNNSLRIQKIVRVPVVSYAGLGVLCNLRYRQSNRLVLEVGPCFIDKHGAYPDVNLYSRPWHWFSLDPGFFNPTDEDIAAITPDYSDVIVTLKSLIPGLEIGRDRLNILLTKTNSDD